MNNKEKIIELLSTAFEMEQNDVFIYLREADLFKRKVVKGEKLSQIFKAFSDMELRHADIVASKLIELGHKPSWSFKKIEIDDSLRTALKKHQQNETKMYQIYSKVYDLCDDNNFKVVVKGIRENEKEHLEKINRILNKIG